MQNIPYEYLKTEISRREEGLRTAQLNGSAFEVRRRRTFTFAWPWKAAPAAPRHGDIATAR